MRQKKVKEIRRRVDKMLGESRPEVSHVWSSDGNSIELGDCKKAVYKEAKSRYKSQTSKR